MPSGGLPIGRSRAGHALSSEVLAGYDRTMDADRNEPERRLRLGSVFGRYRLDALIGRGGMGVVFRATDVSLERPVALKVLSPELADGARVPGSLRARIPTRRGHRAPIDRPDLRGRAIGDTLYIAMRFVPGQDLRTILRLRGAARARTDAGPHAPAGRSTRRGTSARPRPSGRQARQRARGDGGSPSAPSSSTSG